MRLIAALASVLLAVPIDAQDVRPLPDQAAFLQSARKRLQPDEDRQRDYWYVETRRQANVDAAGRTRSESLKIIESYPGLPGEPRWARLIAEDGRPVPAAELEKLDRHRREAAEAYANKLAHQTASDRDARARERAKRRQELDLAIDDAFRVYDIKMIGREAVGGHSTIVFAMTPRPGVKTKTRMAGILQHFSGRAWVSESDYELVKLDVEALNDLSFGLGFLARVHKGSRLQFERSKVWGDTWLPVRASYTASARVLLLKRMRINGTSEFSNYRRFGVDTSTTFGAPSPP
jgi:hypothetical protein